METHPLENLDDLPGEVPEDVAILYSWANMQGAKYRDFSANRREYRAQMRHRAAEQMRLIELRAQTEAEAAAKQAEAEAAAAHMEADAAALKLTAKLSSNSAVKAGRLHGFGDEVMAESKDVDEELKQASMRAAAQQARKAAAEREAAARRAQAAALAESIARLEEVEIAEAQASALRKATLYAEAGLRSRETEGGYSEARIPGQMGDPYSSRGLDQEEWFDLAEVVEDTPNGKPGAGAISSSPSERAGLSTGNAARRVAPASGSESRVEIVSRIPAIREDAKPTIPQEKTRGVSQPSWSEGQKNISLSKFGPAFGTTEQAMSELFEESLPGEIDGATENEQPDGSANQVDELSASLGTLDSRRMIESPAPSTAPVSDSRSRRLAGAAAWGGDVPGPAWLYPRQPAAPMPRPPANPPQSGDVPEPLEHAKERIAARWFALRSVFARNDVERSSERQVAQTKTRQAPIVAVFSLAGGVGKTSLVATLGRALSFLGERVLLSDTTSHGLLPFYFGASQLVSGVVRTFSPPEGSTDAPIHLVSYDAVRENEEAEGLEGIVEDLLENSLRANRVLLDLSVTSSRMVARVGQLKPTILVPLMADMNSVISISAVEKLFNAMLDADGRPLQPVYLLNQFDAALPLHLDIREVLKQQLGDRLLPFVVRRSATVSEALAEGMTVVDYDPDSAVAQDYFRVANWLRSVSAPAAVGSRNQRWSEQ